MLVEVIPSSTIEVDLLGVKFLFRACTQQDIVYAAAILNQVDLVNGQQGAIDRTQTAKYVFRALQSIEGEIKSESGESITKEKLVELAEEGKLQAAFLMRILTPWATEILKAHGFFNKALLVQDSPSN